MRRANLSAPRVTFIATDLSTGGGVNKVIRDLAVIFRQRLGLDVTVVNARSDGSSAYAFPPDIPVRHHRKQSLFAYFRLLMALRRSRPDVVISSWTQDNILTTLAFLLSRTKVVLAEHSSWHFHGLAIRFFRRMIYPLAWKVVVLNCRDLHHYRRFLSNVRLVPDPVTAAPAGNHTREKLIVAVGHLEPVKNFDDAVRAMAASRLEDEGWSLAIIGSGSREESLRNLIAQLGLKRTQIHTSIDDLGNWYARASLLLVTSRSESFSLVLAEAMLTGVVPIAYASDGPSFVLQDFPDHLIRMDDFAALAKQMRKWANTPESETVRQKLRQSIEARFSPAAIAMQWRELLDIPDETKPC